MNKTRSHLRNPNGDAVNPESWNYSSFGHVSVSALHSRRVFPQFPNLAVDPPMEKSKHSSDPTILNPGSSTTAQQ
ncbi:hypothetical protein R3I94_016794 [Phoxinus phoxinus]